MSLSCPWVCFSSRFSSATMQFFNLLGSPLQEGLHTLPCSSARSSCRLHPCALIVFEPISMLWHLSFHSSWYQGLSLFSLAALTLSSHNFFILSKVLSKQSLTTAGLVVSWPNSLFSEPTKSLGGIIHWQCWCLYLSFHLSTLTGIPRRNSGAWVAIINHLHLTFVGQSFLVLFLQNATPHGIWPWASLDAASLFTQLGTSLPTSWLHCATLPWWQCWSEAVSSRTPGAPWPSCLRLYQTAIYWAGNANLRPLSLFFGEGALNG